MQESHIDMYETVLYQCGVKKVLELYIEDGVIALMKELKQTHTMKTVDTLNM